MELREMIPAEQKYTYRQSHQLDAQTGCIGYLRGDFGSTGKEFYSSWFDNMAYLKTPEFQAELDQVINALREDSQYGGILADRNSLSDVCRQSTTPKFGRDESGFRVNTQDYAYLLRLNPSPGDYNFCVYCYKRDYLDRNMRNAEHGIRFITPSYKEKFRIADGDSIRITFSSGETQDRPCRYVDETHFPEIEAQMQRLLESPDTLTQLVEEWAVFAAAHVNDRSLMASRLYHPDTLL